jgi:hypothetical protein
VSDDVEGAVGPDRRSFIKRLVVAGAFAVPVVSSFTMMGVDGVFGGSAGAQVSNPNTTPTTDDPNEDENNRGDENGDGDNKKKNQSQSSTTQGSANAAAAQAVESNPKFTG